MTGKRFLRPEFGSAQPGGEDEISASRTVALRTSATFPPQEGRDSSFRVFAPGAIQRSHAGQRTHAAARAATHTTGISTAMKHFHRRSSILVLCLCAACSGGGGGQSVATPPAQLSYASTEVVAATNVAIDPLLPSVDGKVDEWSVHPALPAGLVLDPQTGAIAGAAVVATPRATYTITASNSDGWTRFELELVVVDPARFAFVTSDGDDTITGFAVDRARGGLVRRALAVNGVDQVGPEELLLHPSGLWAFSPNEKTDNLTTWSVDPASGAMRVVDVDELGAGPHTLLLHQNGHWLYSADAAADEIIGFEFDTTTGQLEPIAVDVATGRRPMAMTFDRHGRYLYLANGGMPGGGAGSCIQAYAVGSDANLTPVGAPFMLLGGKPASIVADPNLDAVYLALDSYDGLLSMRISQADGSLSVGQFKYAGDGVSAIAVHPHRPQVYTLASRDNKLRSFSVDPQTLLLDQDGMLPAGNNPVELVVEPEGRRLLSIARGSRELYSWLLDDETQAPAAEARFKLRGTPAHIVAATGDHPTSFAPRFVHVAAEDSAEVSSFTIDDEQGSVTLTGVVQMPGQKPCSVKLDPTLRMAFVASEADGTIARYLVDAQSGALTGAGANIVVDGRVRDIALEISGRFAYGVSEDPATGAGKLHAWSYDAATGEMLEIGSTPAGERPTKVAVEPAGEFVYVTVQGPVGGQPAVLAFRADPRSGVPHASALPKTLQAAPAGIAFHPSGDWAYLPLPSLNTVAQYAIDRDTGRFDLQPGLSASVGDEPVAVAFSSGGEWAYVAYLGGSGAGFVAKSRVGIDGRLETANWTSTAGAKPANLALAVGSDLLYAVNQGSNDLVPYQIQGADGTLRNLPGVLAGLKPEGLSVTSITQ